MIFYLKGHQNYQNSELKFPNILLLLSKVESLNLQIVAVLMALEIILHTVPHLKALTLSIECKNRHGRGSTFSSATSL